MKKKNLANSIRLPPRTNPVAKIHRGNWSNSRKAALLEKEKMKWEAVKMELESSTNNLKSELVQGGVTESW